MSTQNPNEHDEPNVTDKRRIDPVTGKVRGAAHGAGADASAPASAGKAGSGGAGASDVHVTDEELERLIADATAAEAAATGESTPGASDPAVSAAEAEAAAHLADLQRVTAEYANYRRRTEQERVAARDANTADVLRSLLPVLDDLDRAEQHGDLPADGAMTVVANKLRGALEKLGLTAYGEKGEPFDPTKHEAIAQLPNPAVDTETIADVVERGYLVGERIVRVPKVAVFVPAS